MAYAEGAAELDGKRDWLLDPPFQPPGLMSAGSCELELSNKRRQIDSKAALSAALAALAASLRRGAFAFPAYDLQQSPGRATL